jgi:hypothetical protein
MFQDSFTQIEHGAAAKILDQLNPLLDGSSFDPALARILSHKLPFYEGSSLVEVTDYDVNPSRSVSFVYREMNEPQIFILNGKNDPIYELNKSASLHLDEKNIFLYVRFFFHYVRGRFGRFLIVENVEEIDWKEEPSPAGKKALAKMIKPTSLKLVVDNEFILSASIVFKDSLFESDIQVKSDGTVNLINQELLVEDIPVLDDTFNQ